MEIKKDILQYAPKCSIYKKCSGCQLQNLPYNDQLKLKQRTLRMLLGKFGHVSRIIGMAQPEHYRNKMQTVYRSVGKGKILSGIYQSTNGSVAFTDSCILTDEESNRASIVLRQLFESFKIKPYDPKTKTGFVKSVIIRRGRGTNDMLVTIVGAGSQNPFGRSFVNAFVKKVPCVTGLTLNVNTDSKLLPGKELAVLYGKNTLDTEICGKMFTLSQNSFLQVNPLQTEVLYTKAIEMAELDKGDRVIDAYSGIGTIGIIASDKCGSVTSVELNGDAVANARLNAQRNNVKNIEIFCADAGDFMLSEAKRGSVFDVVFTDPPRSGCSAAFISALLRVKPRKIIYISCNPETLARDLFRLTKASYSVTQLQPVDMFPYTKSIECIALLERK